MGTTPVTAPAAKPAVKAPNPEWTPDRTGELAADLQGIAISAYPKHHFAMLLMIRFPPEKASATNAWVAQIAPRITNAGGPRDICLNVAFSAAGLEILGICDKVKLTFSLPFQEGMTTSRRAHFLGDDPTKWRWSDCAADAKCVHVQLMIYALTQDTLDAAVSAELAVLLNFGLTADPLPLRVNIDDKDRRHEHFGFVDGVSQPILIDGHAIPVASRALHEIPAGEVVLGQLNTYDQPAAGPVVSTSDPIAAQTLAPAAMEGFLDLGLNGTYFVVRQLKQDVAKFWNSMKTAAVDLIDNEGQPATDKWLAQKTVGRTLDGDMLTHEAHLIGNDMTFFADDKAGFGCPITSHVRRANPRDGLAPTAKDTQDMINATNRHRIMRRGRIYGKPIANPYDTTDTEDRGLLFICMNSDIQRQFEFVQHTWLLNPTFGNGYGESDPILGPRCPFTIPSEPVRQQPMIDTFITPVGGGYFFLPSLRALRYLGAI
jgi:Dyp-type peroxidase family